MVKIWCPTCEKDKFDLTQKPQTNVVYMNELTRIGNQKNTKVCMDCGTNLERK